MCTAFLLMGQLFIPVLAIAPRKSLPVMETLGRRESLEFEAVNRPW